MVHHNRPAWLRYLAFRESLRADPVLRDGYGRLKRELAAVHSKDSAAYTVGKTGFLSGSH